jgi:ABC-type Fe3+-hydroxamate transport system substrate-binding protein
MPIVIDQMQREVLITDEPLRIVSLVPSQTELLYYLGLNDEVVGQTLFCVHPKEMHLLKKRVGGTKKINFDIIDSLKPNLIIGNKEENDQEQIEFLMKKYPVWMSDITSIHDAYQMIDSIGAIVNKHKQALDLIDQLKHKFSHIYIDEIKPSLYLIWRKPWMAAGTNTFINEIMKLKGFQNVVTGRYPELSIENIMNLNPQVVLLSSEPYPFKEKHISELKQILPNAQIELVDGELYSWYGNRMLYI